MIVFSGARKACFDDSSTLPGVPCFETKPHTLIETRSGVRDTFAAKLCALNLLLKAILLLAPCAIAIHAQSD